MKMRIFIVSFLLLFINFFVNINNAYTYELADVYTGFRHQILALKSADIGFEASNEKDVYAVLMEADKGDAIITLVAVADGTVSLYFSNGEALIGFGGYENVRKVSQSYIEMSSDFLQYANVTETFPLPTKENVRFYFLTNDDVFSVQVNEMDLLNNKLALSPLFQKAHDLLVEVRSADQKLKFENQLIINAAASGDIEKIQELLDEGVNVDAADYIGWTPLMVAAQRGNGGCLNTLIDAQATLDQKNARGSTALMIAIVSGKVFSVEMLIEKGSDINAEDNAGVTSLMLAAQKGYNDIVIMLLSDGADPERQDNNGLSSIDFAKKNDHKSTIYILQAGNE